MDKIIVTDLEIYAYHGVAPEEKKLGQMFLVSLELSLDLEKAAVTGNLEETVNYVELCDVVKDTLLSEKCDLIESTAMKVIASIFRHFDKVLKVKITLKKPWAPMEHHVRYAAVEIERSRRDRDEW